VRLTLAFLLTLALAAPAAARPIRVLPSYGGGYIGGVNTGQTYYPGYGYVPYANIYTPNYSLNYNPLYGYTPVPNYVYTPGYYVPPYGYYNYNYSYNYGYVPPFGFLP
jgi:hypothetical protein